VLVVRFGVSRGAVSRRGVEGGLAWVGEMEKLIAVDFGLMGMSGEGCL
jgi:hypothetical protein